MKLPSTLGEKAAGFGYVPLDPLPIDQASGADSCRQISDHANDPKNTGGLLAKLPDQTVRFAVGSVDQNKGTVTFGPVALTEKRKNYQAVLDYIQADAVPVQFWIKQITNDTADGAAIRPVISNQGRFVTGYEAHASISMTVDGDIRRMWPNIENGEFEVEKATRLKDEFQTRTKEGFQLLTFPVYVGVGLRLSADILSLTGGVALSGLSAIAVDAETSKLTGRLTVQSLGVSGKSILLPLPSKLDQTTIENAILSIGTMRATLHAASSTDGSVYLQPRIVGLYSPVAADPLLINAIYSELASKRPRWFAPCIGASGFVKQP